MKIPSDDVNLGVLALPLPSNAHAKLPRALLLVLPPPELRVATGRRIGSTNDEEGKPIRVDSARPIHKLLQKQKES